MNYNEIFIEGYYDALMENEEDLDIYDDIENEIDFDNEYEDAYLEGYYTALDEVINANPLPFIGGGDIKGDLLSAYNLGDAPERIAAIKNYMKNGGTIKGGLIGGTYGMLGDDVLYRKNKYLPGKGVTDYDTSNLLYLFLRLKPEDRKKIMNDIKKKIK